MAAPWRFRDARWAHLVVLAAVAAAGVASSSPSSSPPSSEQPPPLPHAERLTFGTTFGNTNVKPNHTYTPPTPPPETSPLVMQPRLEQYTSKLSTSSIKSSGNQNNSTQPPPVRGKDCTKDSHCYGLQNTTCQVDPRDQKKRCLCFDKTGPQNGACTHSRKGPNALCNEDRECIKNAVCIANNATSTSTHKQCQCVGYYDDEDHECDSGGKLNWAPACITVTSLMIAYHVWL